MSALDYFDRIYVINLPNRTDRRSEMEAQLARIHHDSHAKLEFFPAIRPTEAAGFPTIGTRGCFLSHLGVLKNAAERGCQRILIFEDDLNFVDNFEALARPVFRSIDALPWSFFYGGWQTQTDGAEPVSPGLLRIAPGVDIVTAHFLALQGEVISDLVRYLDAILGRAPGDPAGGPMHVDGAYSRFRRSHPTYTTLIAMPELGYQRSSRTDIHSLRWFDRAPLIKNLIALLRKTSNAIR